MQYIYTLKLLNQVKMLMFYNAQITNLNFV